MSDIPGNASTNVFLEIGDTYSGTISSGSDKDWVRVYLSPGQWMEVTQVGSGSLDAFLTVYDADGNPVTTDDAISPGNLNDASVIFGGGAGGTYYVEAGAYLNGSSGSYTLTASAASGPSSGDATRPLQSGSSRSDSVITYYFVENGDNSNFIETYDPGSNVDSEGWSSGERERVEAALATIAAVTNLTFEESPSPSADFQLVLDSDELNNNNLLGFFYQPNFTGQSAGVFNANGFGWSTAGLNDGGNGYSTLIHEFLHGLGLSHPHDDGIVLDGVDTDFFDLGLNGLSQEVFTIMSYNSGLVGTPSNATSGHAATPMALDIAELQDLYGANMGYATGNDSYDLGALNGWHAIWDAGGSDTISYSGSGDVVIDLRAATLKFSEGGGGYISQVLGEGAGFTIANGVTIENASGGSGDDLLIGNDADNGLSGNGGSDQLFGGMGNDTLSGGSGADTVVGATGSDTIIGGSGADVLIGNSSADTISASSGNNMIYGGSGADTLSGGTGSDMIDGGTGNDTINGNGGQDDLIGGRGDDVIDGGAGADTITGGTEQDSLTGGGGADTFVFRSVVDSAAVRPDTITDFSRGTDIIDLGGVASGTLSIVGSLTGDAGQLVLSEAGGDTNVQVDANGDGIAEMIIIVDGVTGLDAGDFIL